MTFSLRPRLTWFTDTIGVLLIAWALLHGTAIAGGVGPISVLIVEESADRDQLTAGQREALFSNASGSVRDYLRAHNYELRLLDKDDDLSRDNPKWQTAFALPRASLPWLYVLRQRGPTVSAPIPKDAASSTLSLLKRYGGE